MANGAETSGSRSIAAGSEPELGKEAVLDGETAGSFVVGIEPSGFATRADILLKYWPFRCCGVGGVGVVGLQGGRGLASKANTTKCPIDLW